MVVGDGCGRDRDVRSCSQRSREYIRSFYALVAGRLQSDGKGVGTFIRSGKPVVEWKHSRTIGTAEVYRAVVSRVPASVDHRGDCDGKGRACDRAGGGNYLKICRGRAAAKCQECRHRRNDQP